MVSRVFWHPGWQNLRRDGGLVQEGWRFEGSVLSVNRKRTLLYEFAWLKIRIHQHTTYACHIHHRGRTKGMLREPKRKCRQEIIVQELTLLISRHSCDEPCVTRRPNGILRARKSAFRRVKIIPARSISVISLEGVMIIVVAFPECNE